MESAPLVSIIMPAYNQQEYIVEALDSVLAQTYKNWECIIVDDGSPDEVEKVVEPYLQKDQRIKFYHTDNGGVSKARNYAINKSRGKYILPLDADDIILPTYIEKCVEAFNKKPEIKLVYCYWEFFGKDNLNTPFIQYEGYGVLLLGNSIFNGAMYKKSDFEKTGGYDESMLKAYEDWEFYIRLLDETSIVYQIPETLFKYRIKPISKNTGADKLADVTGYIFNKHRILYHKIFREALGYKRKYYNIWYKKLWYKYFSKKGKQLKYYP